MQRSIDILCAGELLVDLITAEYVQTPDEATLFKRTPGGSPANLAMHMARLGHNALLIATVGNDDMGAVLRRHVARLGVDVTYVAQVEDPTTLIFTSRSAGKSHVQVYRGADSLLALRQFPYGRFEDISILHTTCFALSRNPAQHVLLEAAEAARRAKCQLSLDANYSEKIWPDRREAQRIVAEYCRLGAAIKISDADYLALYDDAAPAPDAVLDHFFKMGATEVAFTLGEHGCWVGDSQERHFLAARPVDARDATGAGEAFWAGYLTARLDGRPLLERAVAGRKFAEMRLSPSTLPDKIDRAALYADLSETAEG